MAKVKCDICGNVHDEYWMMHYNPGTRTMWLCWDCYKQSQYEVAKSEVVRQSKLHRMAESKKRKK